MRRMFALIAVLVAFAAVGVSAPAALASDPTCTTKTNIIDNWTLSTDDIGGTLHLKCGGAQTGNHGDYWTLYKLQYLAGGTWVEADCVNNGCAQNKPSTGSYAGGSEHTLGWSFSVTTPGQIECHSFRMHTDVYFPFAVGGQTSISWNGAVQDIPC